MIRTLLILGMLVGVVAGLLSFAFAHTFGEPPVDAAIAHTRSVKGVRGVDAAGLKVGDAAKVAANHDGDGKSSSVGQAVDDTWITTKVKAELATTDGVKSTDISVTTEDGVVTLSGALPSELAVKKAVAAARSVKGVRQVDATALTARS